MRVLYRPKKVLELVHLGRPDQAMTGRGNPIRTESFRRPRAWTLSRRERLLLRKRR